MQVDSCQSGEDGGGIFAFSPVSFVSTKALSTTSLTANRAVGSGGGLWIASSTFQMAYNHRLSFVRNDAGADGGGLAMVDGAQILLVDEECLASVCTADSRGNGVCDLQCMTRACSW